MVGICLIFKTWNCTVLQNDFYDFLLLLGELQLFQILDYPWYG